MGRTKTGRDTPSMTDGRRVRGGRRRAEIIDACLRVVKRDGASGVTHRTVAREAGVTSSLTTYYFTTLDDLLVAALSEITEAYATTLRGIASRGADSLNELAQVIVATGTEEGRSRALAERELSTLASRRPALRNVAQNWRKEVACIGRLHTSDPVTIEAFVAAVDGMCASILLSGERPGIEHINNILVRTLGQNQ